MSILDILSMCSKMKNNCFQTTLATGAMEAAMVVAEAMVVVATRAMEVAEAMEVVTKAMEVSVLVICIT